MYRLNGTVLIWFESYLVGRRQQVQIGSSFSILYTLLCGVPPGISSWADSVPAVYIAELLLLNKSHGLRPHLYADDTQMCGLCAPNEMLSLQIRLSACINHVAERMRSDRSS